MSPQAETRREAWRMRIRPGCVEEYIRRHDEIWPGLVEGMRARGVGTYSIFREGEELFVYQEIGPEVHPESTAERELRERWQTYMNDVLIREVDPSTGRPPKMEEIFHVR